MTAIIGAVLLLLVVVMSVVMLLKHPVKSLTSGGMFKLATAKGRAIFVVHLLLQVFFAILLLQLGHVVSAWFSHNVTKIIGIVVAVYLTLSCLPGFLAKGKKGQLVVALLSVVVVVCYWLNALAY
jgi:hypothetical protein